jgi:general L-amino acid transport system permease protein
MTAASKPILPPPTQRYTLLGWLHKNLFNTWFNALLTLLALAFTYWAVRGLLAWSLNTAQWEVVAANLRLFLVGQYPVDQLWRVWLLLYVLAFMSGASLALWSKDSRLFGIGLLLAPLLLSILPFSPNIRLGLLALALTGLIGWILAAWRPQWVRTPVTWMWVLYLILFIIIIRGLTSEGGILPAVPSNLWGGLLLTFLLTAVGIVFSFPIGVALALGRRSGLPVVRYFCVGFIELVRGVPLITVLFMAQLMLPLFMPNGVTVDRVLRAMVGITLFSAAYLAENVRGGLQAIPAGQFEAAHALGLSGFQRMVLIILPQAIRTVIPILVGQFIALFKDTTLVAIVGLFDLLGISRTVLAQPSFIGRQLEVYLFVSLLYFVLSYIMSYISRRIEVSQGVGER